MKRFAFLLVLAAGLFIINGTAKSQNYFTYDGNAFSVLLTCDNSNTNVTKVEFSANGNWVEFKILGFKDLESATGGGFAYTCEDGNGQQFIVDYYRTTDFIKVKNLQSGDEWTLNRRSE